MQKPYLMLIDRLLTSLASQAGAMMSYTLDTMRLKEGALLAVWMTLGVVNLSFWLSSRLFTPGRPLLLSILIALCITTTLFTTGIRHGTPFLYSQGLVRERCILHSYAAS